MSDHYQTLGVSRTATADEIKKAYKKLASKHHPDRGGNEEKFKEVQIAYDTLSDPQKRQQYDNPNPFRQGNGQGFEFNFGDGADMDDILNSIFGGHGRQQGPFGPRRAQPRRNKDLRVNILVSLASTLEAQRKTVRVQTTNKTPFEVDVDIPRGVTPGTTIKYSGRGDNFFESLPRGDLYVIIQLEQDERFELFGSNVLTTLEIDSFEAMIGCEKTVQGIDDRNYKIKIPQGTQPGVKFRLEAQGLYAMNSNSRGDLVVELRVRTPKLTPEQLNQLVNLKDSF
jgi:DnaJ-class molecular chaperone